eukprot:1180762-Prorocentrum_minimum.AAC.3
MRLIVLAKRNFELGTDITEVEALSQGTGIANSFGNKVGYMGLCANPLTLRRCSHWWPLSMARPAIVPTVLPS